MLATDEDILAAAVDTTEVQETADDNTTFERVRTWK